ncbi:cytidine deaminase [Elizabethkingia meningoseptica]|uniref:cytidine deaminase n=1 Tax=Elizabethkingia meningoseptica TaxID=238 RepID=UPI0020128FBA|nr:cytidine deaminase [Elizabethkingia meningoseptica]MCL1675030.1 cytidine deaminase [Elizabethkingia meningoseptica]MCL1685602.1 cytidine deaminase [Elizabethkingia meningoseptica]
MKQDLNIHFEVYKNISELDDIEKKLFETASEIRKTAYAPYSEFFVGCAILLDNGEIITGNNQENAAYPSGLCAERTAIFWLAANRPDQKINKIFVVGGPKNADMHNNIPIPPCGSCRQSIVEYESKQDVAIEIYFASTQGKTVKCYSVKDLLPFSFDKNYL